MILPRRRFLGSSLFVLGSTLLEPYHSALAMAKSGVVGPRPRLPASPVQYIDVGQQAGLTIPNVWGGVEHKRIIETKGSGIAFFDYDHDGWLDIYLTNGSRLDANWPAGKAPTSHLYKNNRDGTFTDVTEKSGLGRTGWQTGVCVGDYDNDGWDDLFCTFWGHNILFHNNGDGTFTDVTKKAGLYQEQSAGARAVRFSITIGMAISIFSSVTSSRSTRTIPPPNDRRSASGRACQPCAARVAFQAIQTSCTTTMATAPLPMYRRRPAF